MMGSEHARGADRNEFRELMLAAVLAALLIVSLF